MMALLPGSVTAGLAQPPESSGVAQDSAPVEQDLVERQELENELAKLESRLESAPGDPEARFLKGLALVGLDRLAEAERVFARLVLEFPESLAAANNLASVMAPSRPDEAIGILERAVAANPEFRVVFDNLRLLYGDRSSRRYEEALGGSAGGASDLRISRSWDGARVPATADGEASLPISNSNRPADSDLPAAGRPAEVVGGEADRQAGESEAADNRPSDGSDLLGTAEMFVLAWARSWSSLDPKEILAFYADDFRPSSGLSSEAWRQQVARQVEASQFIDLSLEGLRVTLIGERAIAGFRQNYRSDLLAETSTRNLLIERAEGRWQIVEERSR